jgi:large subunit ribosomal protein L35
MKLKTHSGAKKRFKISKKGKLLHRGAAISHLLSHKDKQQKKQHHKSNNPISPKDQKKLRKLMPYSLK